MAILSKGITLSYMEGSEYKLLTNLQEIPELGGEAESIEITTLADAAHVYTDGLLNYGDSLAFKFLYETAQFDELMELSAESGSVSWKVELPDGTATIFTGSCNVKLDGAGVNAVLTYTLSVKPDSLMTWSHE